MYIPKHFENTDRTEAIAFIRKYSFGTIVTSVDNIPTATNLPFVVEELDGEIIITSHFAKANPQAKDVFGSTSLIIFTEPHAYISPAHYEKEQNVPTWNYIAIHAYGNATPIDDEAAQLLMMEKMIGLYDLAYLHQWNNLPHEFKTKMLNGIVAFELRVTSLQSKYKLSQNRSTTERDHIITAFEKSADINERGIADYMKN